MKQGAQTTSKFNRRDRISPCLILKQEAEADLSNGHFRLALMLHQKTWPVRFSGHRPLRKLQGGNTGAGIVGVMFIILKHSTRTENALIVINKDFEDG